MIGKTAARGSVLWWLEDDPHYCRICRSRAPTRIKILLARTAPMRSPGETSTADRRVARRVPPGNAGLAVRISYKRNPENTPLSRFRSADRGRAPVRARAGSFSVHHQTVTTDAPKRRGPPMAKSFTRLPECGGCWWSKDVRRAVERHRALGHSDVEITHGRHGAAELRGPMDAPASTAWFPIYLPDIVRSSFSPGAGGSLEAAPPIVVSQRRELNDPRRRPRCARVSPKSSVMRACVAPRRLLDETDLFPATGDRPIRRRRSAHDRGAAREDSPPAGARAVVDDDIRKNLRAGTSLLERHSMQ